MCISCECSGYLASSLMKTTELVDNIEPRKLSDISTNMI